MSMERVTEHPATAGLTDRADGKDSRFCFP